jgi:hypothetical protein
MIERSPSQNAAASRKRSATPGQLHVTLGALVLEGGLGKIERQWQSNQVPGTFGERLKAEPACVHPGLQEDSIL